MKFTIRHRFDTDLDTYWSKVFFDHEYSRRLYQDVLKFKAYKELNLKDEGSGAVTRTVRLEPDFDAPAVIKKILGDKFYYTEVGKMDPVKRRWHYVITPSVLSDKITISGDLWCEERGPKSLERFCECTIEARVFGVGGLLESFVEKETRQSYDKGAAFTNSYLREKGLVV